MKLNKALTHKILFIVKNTVSSITSVGIINSIPEYTEETIFNHINYLCVKKYLIGSDWADNNPQYVQGITSKGISLLESISI